MKESVVILCGGGPAPGINTVISSVGKVFLKKGYRVIGLHEGYKGLFSAERKMVDFDFETLDGIYTRGGSHLKMSRFKPKNTDFSTDFFVENNVKLLVTIGGDDTASTANRISKYLEENKVNISNIHVPKTIDNDLPLPEGSPTFGFHSAKDEGVKIATTVYEDARTSQNWFVLAAMGREAGHLAFGIGTACHFPMIIIPEMFNKTSISSDKIAQLVISSIVKRRIMGLNYGAAIISEGVFHFMSDEEIKSTGVNFTYDAHGHPELFNVSKAHVFNMVIQRKMKSYDLNIGTRPVELGFEVRCCRPIGFDLSLCTLLGNGVYDLFQQGHSKCMVTVDPIGNTAPLFLKDVEDENGKVKPRLVDVNSEHVQSVLNYNLHYLTAEDVEAAKEYLPDAENYIFTKILNWE
ncbi:6-phosphofructokinase [Labilibaculum filiforme]|uniref:6-phosphofructokinase n=1 Tax=Labilibaculum filiforme TaxID=1940526 RepID=A0A2N3HT65_9BACT|nr:6-phosphofructokinase [Labilibaculum filiforme]PKQ61248.1 6-phosphofructokinase [Labilibaculum filiforme]